MRLFVFLALACSFFISTADKASAESLDPSLSWVEIAHFDGSMAIDGTIYSDGFGLPTDANYAEDASNYDYLGSDFTFAVVMAGYTDYFRPVSDTLVLEDVLTSHSNHLWSASATDNFVRPDYYSAHLGGSCNLWPYYNVSGDNRAYLPFWGSGSGFSQTGGCGGNPAAWGQAFTIYVTVPVPEPACIFLATTGLLCLALMYRRV